MKPFKFLAIAIMFLIGCAADHEPEGPAPHKPTLAEVPVTRPATCDVGSTYVVQIDPSLPEVWKTADVAAVKRWSQVLGDSFKYKIEYTAAEDPATTGCVISFPGSDLGRPKTWASTYRLPHEFGTRPVLSSTYVNVPDPAATPEIAYASALHETGHVLGLDHNTNLEDDSVMYKFITVPGQLGCVDAIAVCKIWGCDPACEGNHFLPDL